MNRLMLCAGGMRREGWQTLDCKPGHDFVATIPPLPEEVKAIKWIDIEWIHGITSLYPWEAEAILPELLEALAPGGKLTLEQPDFNKAKEKMEWVMGDATHRDPLIMNRAVCTPDSLVAALHNAGFSRVDILPAQHHVPTRDFRVEAYR